jgi:hypothetical protein
MDLTKIVSISGKSGLFKVISQGKNAVIVESLTDKKRFPAFGNEKMSSLEEISVFTTGEDRPLKDIFKAFHGKTEGKEAPDPKSENKALTAFFLEAVPDFDQERVYISDIRKMVSWYNALLALDLLDFSEPQEEERPESTSAEEASKPEPEKKEESEATAKPSRKKKSE